MEMTTRYISYNHRKMVLVIFYDVTEIERQRIELQEKQTQLDRDLEAAAGIQQSLLPDRAPDIAGIQIAWTFEPSSQIGGDTFNIQQIDKHHIGLYIMDVCGHGVSAAFFAVTVSQFLQSRSCFLVNGRGVASPKTVLDNLNKDFPFERFDSYFSIVYIIIDLMQGRLVYSCAGHPPPVLIHAQGDMDLLNRRGPVIGLSRDTTYHEEITPLYPGDKLILYTDGVFENRNIHKEYLGRQKFYEILKRNASGNIQSLVDATYRRVEDFREKAAPEDDISILGLVYKDPNFS